MAKQSELPAPLKAQFKSDRARIHVIKFQRSQNQVGEFQYPRSWALFVVLYQLAPWWHGFFADD
jgi:hypothetical protein